MLLGLKPSRSAERENFVKNQRLDDNGDIGSCDRSVNMESLTEGAKSPRRGSSPTSRVEHPTLSRVNNPASSGEQVHEPSNNIPESGLLSPHSETTCAASSHIKADTPPQSARFAPGLAEPGAESASHTHKSVIVSCVACPALPPSPPLAAPPQEAAQDRSADAAAALGGVMGHKNAISTESSSIDLDRCDSPSSLSEGARAPAPAGDTQNPETRPSIPRQTRPVCRTKTVNANTTYDIPRHGADQTSVKPSFNVTAVSPASTNNKPTYPTTAAESGANNSLSKECIRPVTGWVLPPGGGLRGGAPKPGETSAISNGTSGWGPPPASVHSSSVGGWGSAPPANSGGSAWGSAPTSNPDEASNGQKLLNPGLIVSSSGPTNQSGGPTTAGPTQPAGSTSWAAAAGKGLPPSEPNQTNGASNGATNKQIEQLQSVREALFSPDGWGGQNVKQDTSWDVGGTVPEPAAPPVPVKQDAMQWQAPSTGRNDGTDLWKSNLSGVPQPPKSQPAAPWGNHTPAHPADYKTWGEPDEEPNQASEGRPAPGNWTEESGSSTQPWDADSGPGKPKEENNGWNPAPTHPWGGSGSGGGPSVEPRREPGWGAPPPTKPVGGSWGGQPPREQWHNESPTIGRRIDDGGTSIWGKGGVQTGAPGGWKDMPLPNLGSRGAPPGPPSRMPSGPGVKPVDGSPWGQPHPGRGWGDEPLNPNPWDADKGRGDVGGWNAGGDNWASSRKPMRSSPSWEDPNMSSDGRWGSSRPPLTKESIWGSKHFRVLCDMGFRKDDIETALRNSNMQLEDALDMLNMSRGGPMPNRGGMPPTDMFPGPRADPNYDPMRFPNPGMPYPPGSDMPPTNASLQNNPSRGGNIPTLVQQMSMGGGPGVHPGAPPRPSQSGTPSTHQLRLLVQQIQMAVQAGHLNAQILNQPLAPQTLLLLNQLLQQIKALQQCQQQHAMASSGARGSGGPINQNALLHISVQITKHKQQITNLQNQITAQQAQYLKSQQPQPLGGAGGGSGGMPPSNQDNDINISLGNITLSDQQQQQQQTGSKLNKWIKNDNNDPDFSRAPGSSKSSTSQPSPNLLLDSGSTWSNGNNGSSGGWPDANDKNSNTAEESDNFGIPEFVPGKAWKGSSIKDPSEDPTLTPGSVSSTPIVLQQSDKPPNSSISNTSVENSLGLTSTTWSFGSGKEGGSGKDGGWGAPLPPSSSSTNLTNLTAMGQDLWGLSRTGLAKPAISGWPGSSNGWSNGTNLPQASSCWLLLKNLTAQIDGSTLRTLCMQHGPLNNFHLYLTHGIALAKYSNGSEAKKAQSALHNCVLGNTTIWAAVADEHEVDTYVRTLSQPGAGAGGQGRGSQPSTPYSSYSTLAKSSSAESWSSLGGSNLWSSSALGGNVWGAPDDQHNRTTPINNFLPPDLLSETM